MDQLLRVHCFTLSQDGFDAGEDQTLERPFSHADPGDMFAWAGATASWPRRTDPGGSRGLDDDVTREPRERIGRVSVTGPGRVAPAGRGDSRRPV